MSSAGRGLDPFTLKRIERFIETHRTATGQLPTIQDFEKNGMDREQIKGAIKAERIEEFFVTLTNGSLVKGFKLKQPG